MLGARLRMFQLANRWCDRHADSPHLTTDQRHYNQARVIRVSPLFSLDLVQMNFMAIAPSTNYRYEPKNSSNVITSIVITSTYHQQQYPNPLELGRMFCFLLAKQKNNSRQFPQIGTSDIPSNTMHARELSRMRWHSRACTRILRKTRDLLFGSYL